MKFMENDILTIRARVGRRYGDKYLVWGKVWNEDAALYLDIEKMQRYLLYSFPDRAWDYARIAAAVYAADRNIKRPSKKGNDFWVRKLRLTLPVNEPDFWNLPYTIKLMTEALYFLTGDDWFFEFIGAQRKPPLKYLCFDSLETAKYFLYSGGLDSAAGLVKYAFEHPKETIIPLLIGHRCNMSVKVKNQIECIRKKFPNVAKEMVASFKMSSPKNEERSQRSRNFLFLVIAGLAAGVHKGDSVLVGENGIGSINLPLSTLMISTMATRGTHPTFMRMMSDLSSHVLGRSIEYSLPNLHLTKGELVRTLKEFKLEELATSTFSCAHPLREKTANQCGQCPACIFRRHSLWVAGIAERGERYKQHLFEAGSKSITQIAREALCNFLEMIERIGMSKTNGTIDWIESHCAATGMTATPELYDLFGRYRQEWLAFCEAAQKGRWPWGHFKMPV